MQPRVWGYEARRLYYTQSARHCTPPSLNEHDG
jgi:hypothetical protein